MCRFFILLCAVVKLEDVTGAGHVLGLLIGKILTLNALERNVQQNANQNL